MNVLYYTQAPFDIYLAIRGSLAPILTNPNVFTTMFQRGEQDEGDRFTEKRIAMNKTTTLIEAQRNCVPKVCKTSKFQDKDKRFLTEDICINIQLCSKVCMLWANHIVHLED